MANMVRKKICNAVREAGVFSLIADESKDCSKQEQLAIILRCVDDKAIIHENFLIYVQATSLTAESLAAYLVDTLRVSAGPREHRVTGLRWGLCNEW